MKYLVTGTAGFIGQAVAKKLLAEGHEVVGVDNFIPYYDLTVKEARWAELAAHPRYTGHRFDLADDKAYAPLKAIQFDGIIHLAAQAGVRYARDNPYIYIDANVRAHTAMLEFQRHHCPAARLVYASSSSVYGRNSKLPYSEADAVDAPASLYAATKRAGELLADTYFHNFNLPLVGLRFFTVYGPFGRPDMAVWGFTKALYEQTPITLFNGGALSRDFTYIDDIVAGVLGALRCPMPTPEHRIYNLGNHQPVVVTEFLQMLVGLTGRAPIIVNEPARSDEVAATYADITRARADFGFSPATDLYTGLQRFVGWYKGFYGVE